MTAADAFLLAVLEQPRRRRSAALYADWLEERGDPRGSSSAPSARLSACPDDLAVRTGRPSSTSC
jgi:uncharacterized protein (TIGR02996 family)